MGQRDLRNEHRATIGYLGQTLSSSGSLLLVTAYGRDRIGERLLPGTRVRQQSGSWGLVGNVLSGAENKEEFPERPISISEDSFPRS
jgi:hypothetical protein